MIPISPFLLTTNRLHSTEDMISVRKNFTEAEKRILLRPI
ncbi:MAG: hypothetical protein ACXVNR_04445 [Bacteroidia bacterium]